MERLHLAVLVLLALVLTGCGNAASQRLVGKWKFDAAKAVGKMIDDSQDGKAAAALNMMQMMGAKMEMVIEFKADQTANITTTGIPFPFSGAIGWKLLESQGDKLTVEFTNPKENRTSKVQITFKDNDHLNFSPPDSASSSMEFERVKE